MKIIRDELMSAHTTMGVGGAADYFIRVISEEDFVEAMNYCRSKSLQFVVVGNGSKVVFSDKGFRGAVIQPRIMGVEVKENRVDAGAGVGLPALAATLNSRGLKGLAWAEGIPATLGGAIAMNAGAYGGQMADIVHSVRAYNGKEFVVLSNKECGFGYRRSIFSSALAVTAAALTVTEGNQAALMKYSADIRVKRKSSQPQGVRSCGSVFKRSGPVSAGELIDGAGLKGLKEGGASVSAVHANFIINEGGATAKNILQLVEKIERIVYNSYNIMLEREIRFIGDFDH